jgi:hypothetical protein
VLLHERKCSRGRSRCNEGLRTGRV